MLLSPVGLRVGQAYSRTKEDAIDLAAYGAKLVGPDADFEKVFIFESDTVSEALQRLESSKLISEFRKRGILAVLMDARVCGAEVQHRLRADNV